MTGDCLGVPHKENRNGSLVRQLLLAFTFSRQNTPIQPVIILKDTLYIDWCYQQKNYPTGPIASHARLRIIMKNGFPG